MTNRLASSLVFGTSFCVLVLEILAGRLLAPIIGVSLETFTGIIGTVLAGIAAGNAAGGWLADKGDPSALIGPALITGGASTWLAPVLVSTLGPAGSADPFSIVFLTAMTFGLPAVVLSSISPMVAKLRLSDLGDTGRVVGNLSAAGTAGALLGTFLTGFVLVAALPTRTIIVLVGLVLVLAGGALTGLRRVLAAPLALVVVIGTGVLAQLSSHACDVETAYACVQLETDPDRPTGRSVILNGVRNSYVDLADPSYLEFRYMRLFAAVTAGQPTGALDVLHLGGAGFTYPRHLNAIRPGSTGLVLEIDEGLVAVAETELGLELSADLEVRVGDARLTISALESGAYDLVVGDAFSGLTIPWHLTTQQFVVEIDRVMRHDGVLVANLIDGGDLDFARSELATYATVFEEVALIVPPGGLPTAGSPRNLIAIASHEPLAPLELDPADGEYLDPDQTAEFFSDALVLDDSYAPVDQLRQAR